MSKNRKKCLFNKEKSLAGLTPGRREVSSGPQAKIFAFFSIKRTQKTRLATIFIKCYSLFSLI
jgi:hypothetical protein